MAKHRAPSRPIGRHVVAAGTIAAGTWALAAAPAGADPVTIPGVGTYELDGVAVPADVQAQIDQLAGQFTEAMAPYLPAPQAAEVPEPEPEPVPVMTAAQLAVQAAQSKIGAPYAYGSAGPDAFDCSGLVQWAYKQAGLTLPRTSYDQLAAGTPVSKDDLQPGDLVSFYGGSHSGIYAGDGMVVHAATSGQPVKAAPVASMPFSGARRF